MPLPRNGDCFHSPRFGFQGIRHQDRREQRRPALGQPRARKSVAKPSASIARYGGGDEAMQIGNSASWEGSAEQRRYRDGNRVRRMAILVVSIEMGNPVKQYCYVVVDTSLVSQRSLWKWRICDTDTDELLRYAHMKWAWGDGTIERTAEASKSSCKSDVLLAIDAVRYCCCDKRGPYTPQQE